MINKIIDIFVFDSLRFIDPLYDKRLVFLPFPLETRTLKVSAVCSIRIQTRRYYICARHTRVILYAFSVFLERQMGIGHHHLHRVAPSTSKRIFLSVHRAISRFRATLYPRAGLNKKEGERKKRDNIYIEKRKRDTIERRSANNGWSLFHLSWPGRLGRNRRDTSPRVHPLETDLSWLVFASAIPPCVHHVDKPRLSGRDNLRDNLARLLARAIRFCVDHHREIVRIFWTGKPSSCSRLIARWWGQEDVAPGLGVVHGSTRGSEQAHPLTGAFP